MRSALAVLVLAVTLASGLGAAERPHVYLVIVDGLDARLATPAHMPRLFEVLRRTGGHASELTAQAVMPTRTNPNHVSLLTGVFPETHGITGNAYWSRRVTDGPDKLQAADLIEVETLFTVAETTAPALTTTAVFAKAKLGRLFAAAPGRQRAPDHLWAPGSEFFSLGGSDDAGTMSTALELFADEPDLAVVQLAEVDRTGHARGPDGPEYARAVASADTAIRRLVDRLEEQGRWQRSVLLVTADHGFGTVAPSAERPQPVIQLASALEKAGVTGVHVVADGGVAHVYADALPPQAADVGDTAGTLARVARVASVTTGVAEVLARLPLAGTPLLAERHPDWHLAHQRTGELLLVAGRGYQFVDASDPEDARQRGNHGSPYEQTVPLFVTGGYPARRVAAATSAPPSAAAVGRTIAALLGLRSPKRVDGAPLSPDALPQPFLDVAPAEGAPTTRTG